MDNIDESETTDNDIRVGIYQSDRNGVPKYIGDITFREIDGKLVPIGKIKKPDNHRD